MLALAQWAMERGDVPHAAIVARRLGLTRVRVSWLLGLGLPAPGIQEEIVGLEDVDGAEPMAERWRREVLHEVEWEGQQRVWVSVRASVANQDRPQS